MNEAGLKELLSPDYMMDQLRVVYEMMESHIRDFPQLAFQPHYQQHSDGSVKALLSIDLLAERFFMNCIARKFGPDKVAIYGEESLATDPDLRSESRICILIDIVDGTDLLERDFSNWCSAIVVFEPQQRKILGSFVHLRSERGQYLYYTTRDSRVYKKPMLLTGKSLEPQRRSRWEQVTPLRGPAQGRELKDASVCVYGQKSSSLLSLLSWNEREKLLSWLKAMESEKGTMQEPKFRFYNLAGNPMMVRLAEGIVDVVLDLKGQHPHDVVPGAYIALLSGAVMTKPNGDELKIEDLADSLCLPARSAIQYVLAANKPMNKELISLLQ
jgi:fructose-1,6-bisphosphatase/inositol monophosphatase family enzyme